MEAEELSRRVDALMRQVTSCCCFYSPAKLTYERSLFRVLEDVKPRSDH